MIVGIGIDIVEVSRIRKMLDDYGSRFSERVFTSDEIAYCISKRFPAIHFSARFFAKEAFFKALGTGLSGKLRWRDVAVLNREGGMTEIILNGEAQKICRRKRILNIKVSLSHTREYAAAVIVLESENSQ